MTTQPGQLGPFRYWGDRKPDTTRPLLTFTRASDAVPVKTGAAGDDAGSGTAATLRIYGPIDSWGGWWGVSAKEVSAALDLLGDVDRLVIRINSPGGDSFEGRAIMNLLRAHRAECTAVVDGLAASAASYIAVGCNETVMSPGTAMMIHDTHTAIYGDAAALRKQADVIESISKSGAELYASVAGGTVEHWRELQRAETWFTADEAVEAKLADRVGLVADLGPVETASDEGDDAIVALGDEDDRARAAYDLSIFTSPGRDKAPALKPPNASAGGSLNTEGGSAVAFSDEQIASLRSTLGLADDADEAAILAAAETVVDKVTEPTADTATEIPPGHVVIPAAKLADLEAGAQLATKTAAQLHDQAREAFLDSVRSKYLPANRDAWAKEYDRDAEATKTHFASAPDLVPVSELGHSQGGDAEALAADADYLALFPDEKKEA